MWRILNKLFGWHYVLVEDCDDAHIERVKPLPSGVLAGKIVYRSFRIYPDGHIKGGYHIRSWEPLTFTLDDMPKYK